MSPGGGRLNARRRLTSSLLATAKAVLPFCHTHEKDREREGGSSASNLFKENSRTVFRSKLRLRPDGELKKLRFLLRRGEKGSFTKSLEGTCGPFLRVGVHVQAFGGEGLSSSLSLRGWRAHLVLEVWVGLRGEEEFHDFGVTVVRGPDERRVPSLKVRTDRERGGTKGEGGQPTRTHITRVSEERGRERQRHDGTTWGGQGAHVPNACKMRTHTKTIPTEFERFRNTNAQQMPRSSMRLKPRIPQLVSDRNSGHVQVVNQKTDLSPQRADTRRFMPTASRAHVAPS